MSDIELFNKYEEAIKILKEEKKFVDKHGSYYGDSGYFDLAIEALEKQLNGGWISVSERLPEENQVIYITFINKTGRHAG